MKKPKKAMDKTKIKSKSILIPSGYKPFLEEVKKRIRSAQLKAATSVNEELIKLYWSIGKDIVVRQEKESWGTKLIEKFGDDIQKEFPGIEGFSRTNIFRMRLFYLSYPIVPQLVGQLESLPVFRIPWGHNILILERIRDPNIRLWYAQQTLEHSWSRNTLALRIDSNLHKRQGKAITNFKQTLPLPHSDLAEQTLKSPYQFDFLTLIGEAKEREIEFGLVNHIQQFLLELGEGFAFVGRQYPLRVDKVDYYLDLLFYNFKLRCFAVIEIKARDFDPRDAGQANFYLSAVDSILKHPDDQPTIGILLYYSKRKQKNITVVYALRNMKSPLGVLTIKTKLVKSLPKQLKGSLPSVKELEDELKTIEIEKEDNELSD